MPSKKPKRQYERWTPAEDKQLRELARGNTPTRVIGVKLGRAEDAIRNHASQIGQSLRPTNQTPYGTGGKGREGKR